jgi:hypothetical protein
MNQVATLLPAAISAMLLMPHYGRLNTGTGGTRTAASIH